MDIDFCDELLNKQVLNTFVNYFFASYEEYNINMRYFKCFHIFEYQNNDIEIDSIIKQTYAFLNKTERDEFRKLLNNQVHNVDLQVNNRTGKRYYHFTKVFLENDQFCCYNILSVFMNNINNLPIVCLTSFTDQRIYSRTLKLCKIKYDMRQKYGADLILSELLNNDVSSVIGEFINTNIIASTIMFDDGIEKMD